MPPYMFLWRFSSFSLLEALHRVLCDTPFPPPSRPLVSELTGRLAGLPFPFLKHTGYSRPASQKTPLPPFSSLFGKVARALSSQWGLLSSNVYFAGEIDAPRLSLPPPHFSVVPLGTSSSDTSFFRGSGGGRKGNVSLQISLDRSSSFPKASCLSECRVG